MDLAERHQTQVPSYMTTPKKTFPARLQKCRLDHINNMRFFLSFFFKMEEDMSKEVSIIFVDSFLKLGTQFFI